MREQTDSKKLRRVASERQRLRLDPSKGILELLLIAGIAVVSAGCALWGTPRAANPPPPCPEASEAATTQMAALPAGSPLVYFLDELGRHCEEIDSLRGEGP